MTLNEAIATQPQWLRIWLTWLLFGAFVLPLFLFIWRQARFVAAMGIIASAAGALGVNLMYESLGYVKLLGLPHILVWTPLATYLYLQLRRADLPLWPRRIIMVVLVTILISLAFDYVDVARFLLGERAALAMPPSA